MGSVTTQLKDQRILKMKKATRNIVSGIHKRPKTSFLTALLVVIAVMFVSNAISDAMKITDPTDPGFNPMEFRFEDYSSKKGNEEDLYKALEVMFPPGTLKGKVDQILVHKAEAIETTNPGCNNFSYIKYGFTNISGTVVNIVYDSDVRIKEMHLGMRVVYSSKQGE